MRREDSEIDSFCFKQQINTDPARQSLGIQAQEGVFMKITLRIALAMAAIAAGAFSLPPAWRYAPRSGAPRRAGEEFSENF